MSDVTILYYLIIRGQLWQVSEAGKLQKLDRDAVMDPAIDILVPDDYDFQVSSDGSPVLAIGPDETIALAPIEPCRNRAG